MLDSLISFDHQLFLLINHLPHTYWSDIFFAFFSGLGIVGLLWLGIVAYLYYLGELRDRRTIISLALAAAFVFFFIDTWLKSVFQRIRPEFSLVDVIVVYDTLTTYSFPSAHATISFAAAYILTHNERKGLNWLFYLFAFLVSFSRIYLGKHYPSDTIAGMILGTAIGWGILRIVDWYFTSRQTAKAKKNEK